MGMCMYSWKFEQQVPSFRALADHFYSITGLELELVAKLEVQELWSDPNTVVEKLTTDRLDYDEWRQRRSNHPEKTEAFTSNNIASLMLRCERFRPIYFERISDQEIKFYYVLGTMGYFSDSLDRTFYELGGQKKDFGESPNPPSKKQIKAWNKLKPWKDYPWYRRPK